MKKFVFLLMLMIGAVATYGQSSNNGLINRAKAVAQQHGCFDDVAPSLHSQVRGTVSLVRIPCGGPAVDGAGRRVYLYAPTPCPPNEPICIQVIVPIAEVIFDCDNKVYSVSCLDNPVAY